MPQQRKKIESERLRGGRDQIKFIDLGFERWQVVRFRKAVPKLRKPNSCLTLSCTTDSKKHNIATNEFLYICITARY